MKLILPLAVSTVAVLSGSSTTTQVNTFQSCLIVFNAGVQAPGMDFSPFPGFMGLFSPSKTFAYTSDASLTGVASGILSYPQTTLEGGASQPFALGVSTIPAGGARPVSLFIAGSSRERPLGCL